VIDRRDFIRDSMLGAGCFLFSRTTPFATTDPAGADSRIEVLLGEPLGTVSPNIYGHFAENLGAVIYDGIWVGEGSKVPNTKGVRKQLVEEMRKIKTPVIRFPGDALRTAMIGATALVQQTSGPGAPTFGPMKKVVLVLPATSTIPINSGPTSLYISAS